MSTSEETAPAAQVVLPEPARQQLILTAADVVGRMPTDEIPAALRQIARFTPAKRVRLGGAKLAAVLDGDDDFRASVAKVVEQAQPELTEALRSGAPVDAADPLDVAVVLYLTRPDGWADGIGAATDRWTASRPAAGDDGQTEALRAEIADLRARAKADAARAKDAAAAAAAELNGQVADLRKQLRARTAELRAAERVRDEAVATADEAQRRLATRESAHEVEIRRIRARVAELEKAATTARRGARVERDIDDARLWLLVETLADAATGVRRELGLSAPSVRPGDTVGGALAGDGRARNAVDTVALDRLLALPHVHLIVDGYNVTKTGYGDLALADQRTRLVNALAKLAAQTGAEITAAFDGAVRPPVLAQAPRGVRVLFSARDEIADDLIRRLVAAEPPGRPVIVVTSDQQVVTDVQRAAAWTAPSAVLISRLG